MSVFWKKRFSRNSAVVKDELYLCDCDAVKVRIEGYVRELCHCYMWHLVVDQLFSRDARKS